MVIKKTLKFSFLLNLLNLFIIFNILSKTNKFDLEINQVAEKKNIVPIAVLGSGPAGLTAGLYGARSGIHTVIFTGDLPGGQLTQTTYIENWPGVKQALGSDIIDGLFEQVKEFGVSIIDDTIVKVDFNSWPFVLYTASGLQINAFSVIIATGSAPRKLGIPGELKYWGRGVSSCAVCDCHFYKDKKVVIVGGGDSAIEEAMQLAHYAKEIIILVRSDKMRAVKRMQDKLEEFDNVKIVYNKQAIEVLGNEEFVTGLKIKDVITKEVTTTNIDGLFLAIGHNPNTNLFNNSLDLNRFGYINVEPISQQTSVKGVFAAGDVEDAEYRQAVVAAASGCKSALKAVKWLREIGLTERANRKLTKNYFSYLAK